MDQTSCFNSAKTPTALEHTLSAAVRALAGGDKTLAVELRANAAPDPLRQGSALHLPRPHSTQELPALRGSADLAALARTHHTKALHLRYQPTEPTARTIFDALETERLCLLGGERMAGMRRNLHAWKTQHYEQSGLERMNPSSATPPLAEMLAFLLSEATTGEAPPEALAPHLREHGAWLRKLAATYLQEMTRTLGNQEAFSRASRQLLEQMAGLEAGKGAVQYVPAESTEDATTDEETRMEAVSGEEEEQSASPQGTDESAAQDRSAWGEMPTAPGEMLLEAGEDIAAPMAAPDLPEYLRQLPAGDYRIFTRQHDEIITAQKLASTEELVRLRAQLDEKLASARGTYARLASQLQRVLLARQRRAWEFDQEEGLIDASRLARLVVSPSHNMIFKHEKESDFKDTVITLLLDNSGSMRGRPITLAAIAADILAKTLERAGVKVEILGFTTRDWKGGDSYRDWVKAGKPPHPGRLNDVRHIIYKSADQSFSRARRNLGLMLKDGILKENIDGEALLWAHHRLLARTEKRRILMVISDGAPVDDSTLSANGSNYLDQHLRHVITLIEGMGKVELLAIGIGHDVTRYYQRSVTINDASRLGETMTKELVALFRQP